MIIPIVKPESQKWPKISCNFNENSRIWPMGNNSKKILITFFKEFLKIFWKKKFQKSQKSLKKLEKKSWKKSQKSQRSWKKPSKIKKIFHPSNLTTTVCVCACLCACLCVSLCLCIMNLKSSTTRRPRLSDLNSLSMFSQILDYTY